MSVDDTQATATDTPAPADTVDVQPSEASTQVDTAPEASQGQEAQEASATDVSATDTAAEKLYAGKYKTPEEMEKAYKSLESKFGQTASEKAELARTLNQAFTVPTEQVATDDSFGDEPNPLSQEVEGLKRNTAVMSFIMSHNDADATAMQKVLAEDPLVKQISTHEAKLEYAYLRSQNMNRSQAIAEAEKKATEATLVKTAEKQTAQVETARTKSETTDDKSDLMNRISSGDSLADREAARKEYIRKYLVRL